MLNLGRFFITIRVMKPYFEGRLPRQRGFSLLEVLVSAFIISILSVSIFQGLTTLELESRLAKDRMGASLLAVDLREEILSKAALDPDGVPVLGREPGESGDVRMRFDDQDDYQGLVDRPASDIGGNALAGMERIWRSVKIESVAAEIPAGPAIFPSPFGLRRFTVTVYRQNVELAHLTWLGSGQMR